MIRLRKMKFLPVLNRKGLSLEMGRVTYSVSVRYTTMKIHRFRFIKTIGSLIATRDVEDTISRNPFQNFVDDRLDKGIPVSPELRKFTVTERKK